MDKDFVPWFFKICHNDFMVLCFIATDFFLDLNHSFGKVFHLDFETKISDLVSINLFLFASIGCYKSPPLKNYVAKSLKISGLSLFLGQSPIFFSMKTMFATFVNSCVSFLIEDFYFTFEEIWKRSEFDFFANKCYKFLVWNLFYNNWRFN